MKKQMNRLLSLFLSLVMVLGMLPTTALAVDNAHSDHSNYITHVAAVEGNCTTPGNIEFWYCDYYTCEKCYSDAAMTEEISPANTIITPEVHSEDCVNCGYTTTTETFDLFVPAHQPDYDEEYYFWSNGGFHGAFSDRLQGFKVLFVGEGSDGKLYAMGNVTNEDGSRQAVDLSSYLNADGSITVNSDTVEIFTYNQYTNIETTYTFSPDNGYMAVMDGEIVVRGQNIEDFRAMDINDPNDDLHGTFPQAIRFEQDKDLSDYNAETGKGYLFSWSLDSGMISFDPSKQAFVVTNWSSRDYSHSIMLYIERCNHPNMKHTEAADATCTEDGAIEHWYCEDCKIYFSNAEATEYIVLPEGYSNYEYYLTLYATGHEYGDDNYCDNCGEIWHPNAIRMEGEKIDPACFEPGAGAYWFCEECGMYLDESKEHEYWEEVMASKIPALGHAFNTDTGECDHCGLENPVYTKVTSLDDVNEEDLYIFVAKVGDKYFALGGLDESTGNNEQGVIGCVESGNAIEVVPYEDGSISLLNQNYVGNAIPSEFMLDVNPDRWDFTEMGLTTVLPLLPNYCVYPFQSYSLDNTGYIGVPRYANGVYGMWDASAWITDFYTTEVDENTYRDDMDGYTHAQQVARGNIGENIAEGDLLMYPASFSSVGGAMFTLRFREYVNESGTTEYYFIAGEDWALVGSSGWDSETDTTPTNDTQYAISLYRYDVPTVDSHTCDFGDWEDDENGRTHTRTCQDETCGKTETEDHGWDNGVETKAPTCTEEGAKTFTCTVENCGATKTESISALDHDWSDWTYDSVDSHVRSCKRNCGVEQEIGGHEWGDWVPVNDTTHKMVCDLCTGEQTGEHDWDNGAITKEPSEYEAGVTTYTCQTCSHTRTEPIDKLPHEHTWTDWEPDGDENHKRTCMDEACAAVETVPHNWDEGKVTTEPTCTESGVKTYTCQTCSHTKIEEISATGHQNESVVVQWSTCSSVGQIMNTCSVCGTMTESTMEIDPDAHEWGEWRVTKRPTYTEAGEEQRICNLNSEHDQTREIASLVCFHSCTACGLCTDADCERTPKCICGSETKDVLVSAPVKEEHIEINTDNIELPAGQTISVVANTVKLPSTDETVTSQPAVNPYEEFILNNAEGMKVETVFEIGLQVTDASGNSGSYELKDKETAEVRLFVGADNAEAIDNGQMYLIHITGGTTITYGKDKQPITAEKDGETYTGFVTFSTDSFSPFVLVSLPGDLDITVNGVGTTYSCTVSISANQAYNCNLYLAAYDSDGKMLAVKVVDSCNLAANPQYTLEFSDTAAYVKAFMMETDGGFTPRCASVTDDKLND